MKQKQLLNIAIAVAALALVVWAARSCQSARQRPGGPVAGKKLLPDFPLNDVAGITIRKLDKQVNLKKTDGVWIVAERDNYPADFQKIGELLRNLWELKTVQPVPVGDSQLGRLELLPPETKDKGATLLLMQDGAGKEIQSLLLGKQHFRKPEAGSPMGGEGYPVGRYLKRAGDADVWLVDETFSQVEPKIEDWLDHDYVKIDKIRSVAVKPADPKKAAWTATRAKEEDDFAIPDHKPGATQEWNTSELSRLKYLLSSATIADAAPKAGDPKSTGLEQPTEAKIETFDGFTYTLRIGKKNAEGNYFVQCGVDARIEEKRTPGKDEKAEDKKRLDDEFKKKVDEQKKKLETEKRYGQRVVLLRDYAVEMLLKELKDFIKEKEKPAESPAAKPAPAPTPATPATTPAPVTHPAKPAVKPTPAPTPATPAVKPAPAQAAKPTATTPAAAAAPKPVATTVTVAKPAPAAPPSKPAPAR